MRKKTANSGALVVGAGPTGLVMALELSRHGVPCRIIDQNTGPSVRSKALVVQVRTLEIFSILGLVQSALVQGQTVDTVNFFMEDKPAGKVTFSHLDSPFPLPLILEQSRTEEILLQALKNRGIEVERGVELIDFNQNHDQVNVKLRHIDDASEESFEVPWLLGCDGAHSTVRHQLDLPFAGSPYPETFILGDVKVDWDFSDRQMYLFFRPEGPLAIFPMLESKRIRLLGICPSDTGALNPNLQLDELQQLMDLYSPVPAKLSDPVWLAKFHLHRRGVPRYQEGRVFVAGDAAHIHSPVGGQGMNTGIQDSFNLAWKIGLVHRGLNHRDFLKSYNEERQPVGQKVLASTDRMFQFIVSKNPVVGFFRSHVMPHLLPMISEFVGDKMAYFMSELGIHYRRSSIVDQRPTSKEILTFPGPKPGDRAPDMDLISLNGERGKSLLHLLGSGRHLLILFFAAKVEVDSARCEEILKILAPYPNLVNGHLIYSGHRAPTTKGFEMFVDPQGQAHEKYGAQEGALYLIRPDGYVAFRSKEPQMKDLQEFLNKHFIPSK